MTVGDPGLGTKVGTFILDQPKYWLGIVMGTGGAAMHCRYDLTTENLALRQQLAVVQYQKRSDSVSLGLGH